MVPGGTISRPIASQPSAPSSSLSELQGRRSMLLADLRRIDEQIAIYGRDLETEEQQLMKKLAEIRV